LNELWKENVMIARTWRGIAAAATAGRYEAHFTSTVVPHLKELDGFRGCQLLRSEDGADVEFVAITFWESIEAVKAFAGEDASRAHVEPEGQAALKDFDVLARHYTVAYANP